MEETMALSVVNEFTVENIANCIIKLPNRPETILANQLAEIYETTTSAINRVVKRYYFQATDKETTLLKNSTYYTLLTTVNKVTETTNNNENINMSKSNMDSDVYDESNVSLVQQLSVSTSKETINNNNNDDANLYINNIINNVSNIDNSFNANKSLISKHMYNNPYLFTREEANMLGCMLHTDIAIDRSLLIIDVFSELVSVMKKSLKISYKKMEELKDQTGTRRLFDRPAFEYKENCSDAKSYYRIEDIDWLVSYFDLTKKGLYQVLEDQLLKASKRTKFPPRFFDKNNPNSIFFRIDAVYDLQLKLKNNPKLLKKFRINLFDTV